MAPPTTLLQFATEELARAQAEHATAQAHLATAQQQFAAARAQLEADTAAWKTTTDRIAAKRAQLATETPANAAALVAELGQLVVSQRRLEAVRLGDADDVDRWNAATELASLQVDRAAGDVAAAQAQLAEEKADSARRTGWVDALAQPPLDTIVADAAAFKADPAWAGAAGKVAAAFPAQLLTAARARFDARFSLQHLANAAVAATERAVGSPLLAFGRAEGDLKRFVDLAELRFDQARATLTSVAAGPALLSAAESAAVHDAALQQDRDDAADAAAALAAAIKAAVQAQAALRDAQLVVDKGDTGGPALQAVADATAARAAAQADMDQAATDFAPHRDTLVAWQALIPDAAWRTLLACLEATTAVDALAGATPATLAATVTATEEAAAASLHAQAQAARAAALVADAHSERLAALATEEARFREELLSAVRGDA